MYNNECNIITDLRMVEAGSRADPNANTNHELVNKRHLNSTCVVAGCGLAGEGKGLDLAYRDGNG